MKITSSRSSKEGGGGPGGCEGMRWEHYAEGLSQGFLSDHPSSGTSQAPHHPHDHNSTNYLHPHYPQKADYFEWVSTPPDNLAEKKIT